MPRKKRIILACVIGIVYVTAILFIVPSLFDISGSISKASNELTKTPLPYTFPLLIAINLNATNVTSPSGVSLGEGGDIQIGLQVTYPNGTLFVGEPVTITAKLVVDKLAYDDVDHILIMFQNWMGYPLNVDWQGLPSQGALSFKNTSGNNSVLNALFNVTSTIPVGSETDTVFWSTEGDYKPIIQVFYNNGAAETFTDDLIVLHVYPQSELAQMETNQVSLETNTTSLYLAWVVFGFGTITIVSLIVQILDHEEKQKTTAIDFVKNELDP